MVWGQNCVACWDGIVPVGWGQDGAHGQGIGSCHKCWRAGWCLCVLCPTLQPHAGAPKDPGAGHRWPPSPWFSFLMGKQRMLRVRKPVLSSTPR